MSKGCETCKFYRSSEVSSGCKYYERFPSRPSWMPAFMPMSTQVTDCKVWEPREPKVKRRCGTCEHWSERGQGADGYGHGPCMAVVPIWAITAAGRGSSPEMDAEHGEKCASWKWREFEEDLEDE